MTEWNPRYLAYALTHGQTDPAEMLRLDRERWPGGVMCGFIVWMGARWAEWKAANGNPAVLSAADHAAFDEWLKGGTA